MKNIFSKLLLVTMVGSFSLLLVLLRTTSPQSAGAMGIMAIFILAYTFIVCVLCFFMYGVSRIIVAASRFFTVRKPLEPMSLKRSYYYASVIGLAPVIVISMNSVGALGAYEVGLVLLLVVIGCIYVTKRAA